MKLPRLCPKNSLSMSSEGMAPQLTGTNAPSARGPEAWIMRATSSLPVPDSPEMCTGAWLRATRWISSRSRSIDGALPMSCGPVARVVVPASDDCESLSAVATMRRRTPRSSGLDTKSKAPSLRARTADSTLPCAVMTAQGTCGQCEPIHSSRSRPSPSGRRMSVRQRSNGWLLSSFLAVVTSPADWVSSCMRDSVSVTSSTRSGSSSTTSTSGGDMGEDYPQTAFMPPSVPDRETRDGTGCRRWCAARTGAWRRWSAPARATGTVRVPCRVHCR